VRPCTGHRIPPQRTAWGHMGAAASQKRACSLVDTRVTCVSTVFSLTRKGCTRGAPHSPLEWTGARGDRWVRPKLGLPAGPSRPIRTILEARAFCASLLRLRELHGAGRPPHPDHIGGSGLYQHEIGRSPRFFFPLPCPAVELAGG
jgi:hypothetical protein